MNTKKTLLILGKYGMLAQALIKAAPKESLEVVTISKADGKNLNDIKNIFELKYLLNSFKPDILFNATGITDLNYCEKNPEQAWLLHARLPAMIADWSRNTNVPWVHVSTDHYYTASNNCCHTESDAVAPMNEYAASKLAGEYLALTSHQALVLRTNIIGKRAWKNQPNFAEWVINNLKKQNQFDGYIDTWASSIEAGQFASLALTLAKHGVTGLMNLACSESISKAEWIEKIAQSAKLKCNNLNKIPTPEVNEDEVRRANAMGLDCSKSKAILNSLGMTLPDSNTVAEALVRSFKDEL
jgi:dTDP-4-dehydrorhamnose reductase